MTQYANTSVAIVIAGLAVLMFGYGLRDTRLGPLLILGGVVCILSVITWYVLKVLRVLD